MINNLVNSVAYDSEGGGGFAGGNYNEAVPAQYLIGYKVANESSTIHFDIADALSGDNPAEIRLGSEWKIDWFNMNKEIASLRFGYRSELMTGDNATYSIGTGLNYVLKVNSIGLNLGYLFRPEWNNMSELRFEVKFEMN